MEKTFETPGGADLVVHNQVGLVVVTARDMATTAVSLEADTPVGEELVERATVECKKAGDRHVVAVKLPHQHGLRMLRRNAVTVRVEVPDGGQVTVATASADIEINGSVGEVDVKTASGDASVDDVAADVKATTASGSITMGTVGGDIKAQDRVGRPALLERGGLDPVLHRLGRPGGGGGREPGGGQGDLGQRAAGRGRPRSEGGQRVGQRPGPDLERRRPARPLRLGGRCRRRGQGGRPPRRHRDGLGHRALRDRAARSPGVRPAPGDPGGPQRPQRLGQRGDRAGPRTRRLRDRRHISADEASQTTCGDHPPLTGTSNVARRLLRHREPKAGTPSVLDRDRDGRG